MPLIKELSVDYVGATTEGTLFTVDFYIHFGFLYQWQKRTMADSHHPRDL
jgi:hypothetical protein